MSGFNDISNNGGPGSTAEPSMEEILASIRRILKEDETGRGGAQKVDLDEDVLVLDATMVARSPDLSSAALLSPTELPAEQELAATHATAPVTSYHNELHIASAPAPLDLQPEPPAQAALHETLPPDWEAEMRAPAITAEEPAAFAPAPEQPPSKAALQTEQPASPPHEAVPEPEMSDSYEPPEAMVSDAATRATKQSIGALVRSISMEKAVAVSRGGTTIEDIVREEIRPMLKSWLDSHLPMLVERIVRAEIERVVDRTQL